ncbi:MAG: YbaB/EbfC family nucleoid-associated protein [Corynebacterium sp.]|nr:YbaB/EbfC family nucleoid-associated protein [Corynebacterium sp.]
MSQPDITEILAQAQQMQSELEAAQQEILQTTVTGVAGNGLVSVEMKGSGEVAGVTVSPEVVNADDVETLQDLIVGAFNDAHTLLAQLAQEKLGPLSQGFEGSGLF